MKLEEKRELIQKFYDGDYYCYFYDTVREYLKKLNDTPYNSSDIFLCLVEEVLNDIEEIVNYE